MFLRNVKPEAALLDHSDAPANGHSNGSSHAAPAEAPLDPSRLPKHIAIIMDGNRRWAKDQGWRAIRGHSVGADVTQNVIQECVDLGIHALTLYTFSTENWKRSSAEVGALMRLNTRNLKSQLPRMQRNNVQIRHIGLRDNLPDYLLNQLDECTNSTIKNTGLVLNLALNYGGRAEIADTFRKLMSKVQQGLLKAEEITEDVIGRALYTGRFARTRFDDSHRRRNAHFQFSALANRLRRTVDYSDFVARIQTRRTAPRHSRISIPRPPSRKLRLQNRQQNVNFAD